ncbi:UDP-3-O-[3-hydroxymyristoyl] glucosamine N-acyltransferase [Roseivirga pacifica]|uniref:UDP-3-O-[3-hydroxymyristoyl] glucosamine N-acyltransferase n=1 Tax=Roseivirga pacifica TaxID=1267423 RepID=A0A1I0N5S9_9BACT|nr:UDP-3-O-(3-hydroxymyristoyl)glucosamine N-acyltransferase [Roseivirga pacifica]RKQ50949.1 UDP-3-O-[3-hydroxymyristoyl] glucosamine N-acyltransferase [Roseivirga pacifica]SEV96484.1 UDP-3-O-[3-hydroxymyristoyl] glucosamine N-acyltransferase [Roseivirga pacifica]
MEKLSKKINLSDITAITNGDYLFLGTSEDVKIDNISIQGEENVGTLDWCSGETEEAILGYCTQASAGLILVKKVEQFEMLKSQEKLPNLLLVENPKLVYAKVYEQYKVSSVPSVSSSALINEKATLGANLSVGDHSVIGNVRLGNNVKIENNVVIYDGVSIGNNVKIGSNTVIGSEGFGYIEDGNNVLVKFPHIASVIIENDVEIGSNTSIDRGALKHTTIRTGVKIDNLVHIAHNVEIGKHSHIIANSMIAGSVKIGERVWVAPSSNILEHLHIGDDVKIGVGSVVTKNIPSGETWTGAPARELGSFLKTQRALKGLIDL